MGLSSNNHYFTNKPDVEHDLRTIEATLRGKTLRFLTDAGVFSKGGVDFGSRLLIETMDVAPDDLVLDVGCGYGPIGISAALQAVSGQVTMVDVNERAVGLAKRNAELNGVRNVSVQVSDLYEAVPEGPKFSVIASNPPIRAGKETVHAVFEGAARRLTEDGSLWIVIQKKQGAPSAVEKLESLFVNVEIVVRDKGYWILKSSKVII